MRTLMCLITAGLAILPLVGRSQLDTPTGLDRNRVAKHFGAFSGCLLMRDLQTGASFEYGTRCDERLPPCSTFKVPHALIGLELGLIDENSVFPNNGGRQPYRAWEGDQTLASALRHSVLWAFQQLSLRIGRERMVEWLAKLSYGHGQPGPQTTFWLDGSLTVSARDQLDFALRFYGQHLPVDPAHIGLVRDALEGPFGSGGSFGGKTGTCQLDGKLQAGWFVGRWEKDGRERIFVTLIRADDDARGARARAVTEQVLLDLER